ncbi:MAG: TetR/AcrR family transcriptional regulator [Rhodoferax sp.]|nr:TetR/AcrR family transcriptional regulator [Rhodoferax sp.]
MPTRSTTSQQLTPAPVRRARRKDARPGELLAAALDLFVEKGFAATRVEEVAHRAGVSKGTLFLYFPSKEELFKAVVRAHLSGHFVRWGQEIETFDGSSAEMLRYALSSWWQHIGSTQASGIPKLMMSEAGNFPQLAAFYRQEVIEPGNALLARILQRGVARGEFRPLDLKYGVYLILAPLVFLVLWKHSFAPCCDHLAQIDPPTYLSAQIEMLLHGLSVC